MGQSKPKASFMLHLCPLNEPKKPISSSQLIQELMPSSQAHYWRAGIFGRCPGNLGSECAWERDREQESETAMLRNRHPENQRGSAVWSPFNSSEHAARRQSTCCCCKELKERCKKMSGISDGNLIKLTAREEVLLMRNYLSLCPVCALKRSHRGLTAEIALTQVTTSNLFIQTRHILNLQSVNTKKMLPIWEHLTKLSSFSSSWFWVFMCYIHILGDS